MATTTSYLAPFATAATQPGTALRDGQQAETNRLLADLAPHIMRPRMLQAAAAASASVIGSRDKSNSAMSMILGRPKASLGVPNPIRSLVRLGNMVKNGPITSTDLRLAEASEQILLSAALGGDLEDEPTGVASEVSFLRGFEATQPSALDGRARRRKARGRDAPHLGLIAGNSSSQGLLTDGRNGAENPLPQDMPNGRDARKVRRAQTRKRDLPLTPEELQQQLDEIVLDKDNLQVRRVRPHDPKLVFSSYWKSLTFLSFAQTLLNSDVEEVANKIAELEKVRKSLQRRLVGLKEEELELADEQKLLTETLALHRFHEPVPGRGLLTEAESNPSVTHRFGRRVQAPLFLPSEHDDLPKGVAFMTLFGHTAPVTALDFSEPYDTLISAAADDTVRVWDLTRGEEVGRLRGHTGSAKCLQVEDELCVSGGGDATLRVWDLRRVEEHEMQLELAANGYVGQSCDAEKDAAGPSRMEAASNSQIGVGETQEDMSRDPTDPCLMTLEGHSNAITALYMDDTCLVSGGSDKTLRQWDLNTGQCVLTMDILWAINNPSSLQSLGAGDQTRGTDRISSPRSNSTLPPLASTFDKQLLSGNFSYPTPPLADGSWDLYQDFVGGIQFWGYALASGSADGAVRMWDMRTGQAHRTLLGHGAPVTTLQFDETHIVSGSLDRTIKIWDLRTGSVCDTIRFDYPVSSLQFDSRKIVAAAGDNALQIFNRISMETSTLTLNGHSAPVEQIRYMDSYGASGARDSRIKIWSL